MSQTMPTDIDALIADVLRQHAETRTSLPWRAVDEDTWEEGFEFFDGKQDECVFPVVLEKPDAAYLTSAANAAPVLARELEKCRAALERISKFYIRGDGLMGGAAVEIARAALTPEAITNDPS